MYSTQRGVYKLGDLGLASLASSGIHLGVEVEGGGWRVRVVGVWVMGGDGCRGVLHIWVVVVLVGLGVHSSQRVGAYSTLLDVKHEIMYSTQRGVYKLGSLGLASLASSGTRVPRS